MNALLAVGGLSALQGFMQYGQAKAAYKQQAAISAYQNQVNAYNYTNTLLSINENAKQESAARLDKLSQISQQEMSASSSIETNMAVTGTTGNTAKMLQSSVKHSAGVAKAGVEESFNASLMQEAINTSQAYLQKMGSYAVTPTKPSLVSYLANSALSTGAMYAMNKYTKD